MRHSCIHACMARNLIRDASHARPDASVLEGWQRPADMHDMHGAGVFKHTPSFSVSVRCAPASGMHAAPVEGAAHIHTIRLLGVQDGVESQPRHSQAVLCFVSKILGKAVHPRPLQRLRSTSRTLQQRTGLRADHSGSPHTLERLPRQCPQDAGALG